MSRFIRCDRCTLENAIIGTVTLPPGWQTICHADLCERCCETVREFIRFRPSDADKLPVEPIPTEAQPAPAPSEDGSKLFETVIEKVVEQVNAGALNTPGVTCTASIVDESSAEERTRTRKSRKLRGQDAILPDPRKPSDPPAPGAPLA